MSNNAVSQGSNDLPTLEVGNSTDFMLYRAKDSLRLALQNNSGNDPRPFLMTVFMLGTVPDKKFRAECLAKMKEYQKEYCNDDIRSAEMHVICALMVGPVTDWEAQYRHSVYNLAVGGSKE